MNFPNLGPPCCMSRPKMMRDSQDLRGGPKYVLAKGLFQKISFVKKKSFQKKSFVNIFQKLNFYKKNIKKNSFAKKRIQENKYFLEVEFSKKKKYFAKKKFKKINSFAKKNSSQKNLL